MPIITLNFLCPLFLKELSGGIKQKNRENTINVSENTINVNSTFIA